MRDGTGQARAEGSPPLRDSGVFFSLQAPQAAGRGLQPEGARPLAGWSRNLCPRSPGGSPNPGWRDQVQPPAQGSHLPQSRSAVRGDSPLEEASLPASGLLIQAEAGERGQTPCGGERDGSEGGGRLAFPWPGSA